jgi:hypothetical protein
MTVLKTLGKGATAAVLSYKLILLIWVVTLVMVFMVALPLKSFLANIFGNSMAVLRLSDGFDLGLAGDMGKQFVNLLSAVTSGGLLLLLAGFLLYTFFAGGLFASYATAWGSLKMNTFIRESARNFLPFLKIAVLILVMIAAYTFIIVGIPIIAVTAISGGSPGSSGLIYLFVSIWALGIPIWLFVADASRRWIAATGSGKVFRALSAGFMALKERFWLSYGIVLVILILNVIFVLLSLWFTASSVPEKGGMIFLFFLASQLLFIIRLFMKSWRYASVCEKVTLPARDNKRM